MKSDIKYHFISGLLDPYVKKTLLVQNTPYSEVTIFEVKASCAPFVTIDKNAKNRKIPSHIPISEVFFRDFLIKVIQGQVGSFEVIKGHSGTFRDIQGHSETFRD